MATFSVKPTEGQDPWGATDLAWRASVESAVNASEVTIDKSAGIKVSVQDNAAGRKQLIYGDTGIRDVSGLLINGWTGTVTVQRTNYDLAVIVESLTPPTPFVAAAFLQGMPGLVPAEILGKPARATLETLSNPSVSWRVSYTNSSFSVAGSSASLSPLSGVMRFKTYQQWPATLPGTAVGSIPNA